MNCPSCGFANGFDAVFCSKCATKLSGAAGAVDPSAARQVPYNPIPQPPPPYANPYANPYMAYDGLPRSTNSTTILVLGILSLVVCAVMGPIAWSMGKKELDHMNSGLISREGYGMVQAGYVCGIIGTVLLGLSLLWLLFALSMF